MIEFPIARGWSYGTAIAVSVAADRDVIDRREVDWLRERAVRRSASRRAAHPCRHRILNLIIAPGRMFRVTPDGTTMVPEIVYTWVPYSVVVADSVPDKLVCA
jgi:hypothetical protein